MKTELLRFLIYVMSILVLLLACFTTFYGEKIESELLVIHSLLIFIYAEILGIKNDKR